MAGLTEEQFRSVVDRAVRDAVNVIVRAAKTLEVDPAATMMTVSEPKTPARRHAFQIGSKPGESSYADVIAKEYEETEFEFARAWNEIKHLISTTSPRARGSAIRALDNDRRFARIPGRKGIWYRRMDHTSDKPWLEDE